MTVVATADMYGISGRRDELVAVLADAERTTAGRPGCRRYVFAAALADRDRFVLVSEWDDQAALDAHYASEEFARFQFALQGLLARPSDMTIYTVSTTARPVASGPMDPRDAD
ncbi:MAG TPA: putative quinol monooxygenase [Solirubrobacteraceae bacterium]